MAETYRPVLVPERHVKAVEAYLRDLNSLDELGDSERGHDGGSRPTLFASPEPIDGLQN